jgi:hypothetical protein
MLSQLNLIRVKERILLSPDPHQNLFAMPNLHWEMGNAKEG